MGRKIRARFRPGWRGFYPNQSPLGAVPDTMIAGRNCMPTGPGKLIAVPGGGGDTNVAKVAMFPLNADSSATRVGGVSSAGSIIHYRKLFWWITSGSVSIGPSSVTAPAPGVLQFATGAGGTVYNAGLVAPTAPVLSATTTSGNMSGSWSAKIAQRSSLTGSVSNASLVSNILSVSGKKIQINLPARSRSDVDKFYIYMSKRGFATIGPWYFLEEKAATSSPQTNVLVHGDGEWTDADLAPDTAPFDHFPPPSGTDAGTHVISLGGTMAVLGCYGGTGIAPSYPSRPEEYDPELVTFLPGKINGLVTRAADGLAYVWGANYLATLILIPGGAILPRLIWGTIGLPGPGSATLVDSELWGYTDEPVRTTQAGEPDTSFALPVREYMRSNWGGTVTVGYCQKYNAVVFANGAAAEGLMYFRSLDAWSAPFDLPAVPTSFVQSAKVLLLSPGSGTCSEMLAGTGQSWNARSAYQDCDEPFFLKTLWNMQTVGNGITADLLVNLSTGSTGVTQSIPSGADAHSASAKINLRNVRSAAVQYTGGASNVAYDTIIEGWTAEAYL